MYGELPEIKLNDGTAIAGFPVRILNSPTGEKSALLRLPTSDELLTYLGAQKSLYRDLGRRTGKSEDVPTPKADLALFLALRLDKGVDFDADEALYAIGLITKHRVESCERDGSNYVVKIVTLFGEVVHTVRIPYHNELAEYRRRVYESKDLPNNLEERRFPPEVPVKLYDKIIVEFSGYQLGSSNGAGGHPVEKSTEIAVSVVPPHHKRTVVTEVVSALSLLDPDLDPNS